MHSELVKEIKDRTGAVSVVELDTIQTLWSGYGQIVRLQLIGGNVKSLILKKIDLSAETSHPRGWNTSLSHERKIKSYAVEMNWYAEWNTEFKPDFRMANPWLVSRTEASKYIVLEDLDAAGYPIRKDYLSLSEAKVCVKWLANFHGYYLGRNPEGLWKEGTYWHLDTRPDEFKAMDESRLKNAAKSLD